MGEVSFFIKGILSPEREMQLIGVENAVLVYAIYIIVPVPFLLNEISPFKLANFTHQDT